MRIHQGAVAVAIAAASLAYSLPAAAQTQLTRNQIVQSLARSEGVAKQFDPIAVEREAQRAVARGDGGSGTQTLTESLARLPQLSVEINFDRGSARIRPESYRAVGLIADALHTPYLMGGRIAVVGHTDATGTREFNMKLSKQRARSVAQALSTTFNVPANRLVPIGLGEEALEDPANPNSGVNRRVQLINVGE